METSGNKTLVKNSSKYYCEVCDFKCSRNSEWSIHIQRPKHLNGNVGAHKTQYSNFICECGKKYISKSGLWKHTKLCSVKINNAIKNETTSLDNSTNNNLILEILKQNHELKEMMMEQNKHMIELAKKK